ncbi:MAG: ATP phosphoribosyltransferase regulatory subunit [Oscillospiraceae bacterium]|nr:ATP phosphoribosyltransferase regulatory subunit [Oscillospiraceae bacterium]
MNNTIGTPEGTRDRLFAECRACRQVEKAVTQLFKRRGYCEVTTPNVEYYDMITAAGHPLPQESMLKIVDRTGKILVMRPDQTVAIGRVAASKLSGLPRPLRLYYNQTVFRSDDVNTGARSEIDQCGVELIGAQGVRADLEVISMAIDALDACGLKDYHIEIGHAGYFSALLEGLGLEEPACQTLRELVEKKDFVAYRKALAPYQDRDEGRALMQLPRLFGSAEVLEKARQLCPAAEDVISYLETIYDVLAQAGLSNRVQFDLGLIQTIEYYTGMIFRGFSEGAGSNVISGGRYDRLIGQFGDPVPATGFAVDVQAVADCLPMPEHKKPETVVWYTLSRLGQARELVSEMPKQTAMLSCGDSPEAAAEEARQLGAERLILVDETGVREVAL